MLINLRNAMMAGKRSPLPPGARWVEYLESTGTQYIETGVTRGQTSQLRLQSTMSFSGSASANAFGWGQSLYGPCVGIKSAQPYMYFNLTGTDEYSTLTYTANTVVTIDIDGASGRVTINDGTTTYTATRTVSTQTSSGEMVLFGFTNSAGVQPRNQRINACKIYVNGVLVRDFRPIAIGNTGYMLDMVSGQYLPFGNAGTGDFVVGPDVVPVEYIESHGTEWIDTGYIPNQQTRWEFDYQFSTIGSGSNGMFQENPTVRFNIGQGTDGFFNISYGANNALNIASDTLRHLFVADIPNLQWRLDSYSGAFPAPVSTTLQYSLRIFCRNSPGGTVYNRHSGKCFASRMYQSDALSQRLLPIRVGSGSTWEGAMMDTLTRRIYRNQGTGAFSYGNDLPLETLAN